MSGIAGHVPQLPPRGKLLLLVAVFVAPVIAAYLAYFGWRPAAHTNYGELLAVAPLQRTAGHVVDGTPLDLQALRGKWVMVRVGPAACNSECARQLYLMRQLRLALGKDQARIERVWVVTGSGEAASELLKAHAGLRAWRPADAAFVRQLPAAADGSSPIYLVDPLGNTMMRFPARPDPKRMMKDLKLLLKASQVG
jgi:cytochrome oxidase Cu insertion factor (SCO1/SenC/PrrC family)